MSYFFMLRSNFCFKAWLLQEVQQGLKNNIQNSFNFIIYSISIYALVDRNWGKRNPIARKMCNHLIFLEQNIFRGFIL